MLAYLDCTSGISGDKFLAALLDAGEADGRFTTSHLAAATDALGLAGVRVESTRVTRAGISGAHLAITAEENPPHRTWPAIRDMIEGSSAIPRGARDRALRAFEALARAEARAHGTTEERVHFHEVGAADSIADIVGVSLGLELFGIERLICSRIALGEGTVRCEHGVLPVPAPATLELLRGVPVYGASPAETGRSSETGELTTPTGAALIVANADGFGPMPDMLPTRIGYGAGSRDIAGLPNVARLVLGHQLATLDETLPDARATTADGPAADERTEPVVLLETTLDHLSPEQVAFAAEELRDTPALDVWQAPAAMKKGRLGIELRVLVRPGDADAIATRVHELTGTLGVRRTAMERSVLEREVVTHDGPWGPFRVKVSGAGASARVRPEHDDIARIARETGEGYEDVARRLIPDDPHATP